MSNTIPVMFCFNNNYAIAGGVAFYSMLENANKDFDYKLFVLHNDITEENQCLLKKTVKMFPNADLTFVDMNNKFDDLYSKTKSHAHFSKEMYYKFLAPSIFKEFDKILITDVDVVFLSDISTLYNDFDVREDYYFSGVAHCSTEFKQKAYKEMTQEEIQKLLVKAGLLVYNLKKMRQDNCEEKFIDFALKNAKRIKLPEQDTINIVCYPKIKKMPANAILCCCDYLENMKEEDLNNIIQYHYAKKAKPWNAKVARADLWFKYLLKTPMFEKYMEILEEKFNPKIKTVFSFAFPFYKKKFSLVKIPR